MKVLHVLVARSVSSFILICYNELYFQVRVAALQNLVKIMSLYYQYMETYMGPALFAVRQHVGLHRSLTTSVVSAVLSS